MTYPSGSGVINNQWGPAYPDAPAGNEPPPTGDIVVPQAPSGSVTNESASFNYVNTITSTENYLSEMIGAADEGIAFNFSTPAPALNVAEILPTYNPNADSGVQEGTPAINAADPFTGVLPANAVNVFRWE